MDKRKFQTQAPDLLQRLKMKTVVKKSHSKIASPIKSPAKRTPVPVKSPSRKQPPQLIVKSPSRYSPKKNIVLPSPSRTQIKSILKSPKRK